MKFFADTADIGEIRELVSMGLIDGVTTNPSLIARSGRDFKEVVKEICAIVEGPVSAEVTALDADGMGRLGFAGGKQAGGLDHAPDRKRRMVSGA